MQPGTLLIVTFWYPPFQAVASNRTAAFAKYMERLGWKVHVITAAVSPLLFDGLLYPYERVGNENILRINGFTVSALLRKMPGGGAAAKGELKAATRGQGKSLKAFLYRCYDNLACFPDDTWPWFLAARGRVTAMARKIQPDIVISSSFPVTAHLLASRISSKLGIPWIADYRDLWTQNHSRDFFPWVRSMHRRLEKRCLANALACVTVSEPLQKTLEAFAGVQTRVIENGYDEEEYAGLRHASGGGGKCLRIIYTGMIYPGNQDIEPLFQAVQMLEQRGEVAQGELEFIFYGSNYSYVRACAEKWGVAWCISSRGQVPRSEVIGQQVQADVLLFLKFNTREGVLTGKLFEYIGARRPILSIGEPEASVDRITQGSRLGYSGSSAEEIGRHLDIFPRAEKNTGGNSRSSR